MLLLKYTYTYQPECVKAWHLLEEVSLMLLSQLEQIHQPAFSWKMAEKVQFSLQMPTKRFEMELLHNKQKDMEDEKLLKDLELENERFQTA